MTEAAARNYAGIVTSSYDRVAEGVVWLNAPNAGISSLRSSHRRLNGIVYSAETIGNPTMNQNKLEEVQEAVDEGVQPYKDPEVLGFLYNELEFTPHNIANTIFHGEITPNTVRYHLQKHGLTDGSKGVSIFTDTEGYEWVDVDGKKVNLARLNAYAKGYTLSDLRNKEVQRVEYPIPWLNHPANIHVGRRGGGDDYEPPVDRREQAVKRLSAAVDAANGLSLGETYTFLTSLSNVGLGKREVAAILNEDLDKIEAYQDVLNVEFHQRPTIDLDSVNLSPLRG